MPKRPARTNRLRPKYVEVVEHLKKMLDEGAYAPGTRIPTEYELPHMLKAGRQTVVRALRALVQEGRLVRRRGDGTYVAEPQAPPVMPGTFLKIGILWPHSVLPERMDAYFQGAMTMGALHELFPEEPAPVWARTGEKEPTRVSWTSVARGATAVALGESRYSHERHPDLDAIRAERFHGLVVLSIIETDWLERLLDLNLPAVIVDYPNDRFTSRADHVYVDPIHGYRNAVLALAEAGARRIHFVGAKMTAAAPSGDMDREAVETYQEGRDRIDPDSLLRLHAFRLGMDVAGLPFSERQVHFEHSGRSERIVQDLLSLPERDRPQALVCHDAGQAERIQQLLGDKGLQVACAGSSFKLMRSTVMQIGIDGRDLGRTAIELLLWRLQCKTRAPMRVGVPMTLGLFPSLLARSSFTGSSPL